MLDSYTIFLMRAKQIPYIKLILFTLIKALFERNDKVILIISLKQLHNIKRMTNNIIFRVKTPINKLDCILNTAHIIS